MSTPSTSSPSSKGTSACLYYKGLDTPYVKEISSSAAAAVTRRDFRPAEDILYVSDDDFSPFTAQLSSRDKIPPFISEARHLALALPAADRGLWLPLSLKWLPKLETISIIFPRARNGDGDGGAEGHMDIRENVVLTEEQAACPMIRPLTPEESDQLMLDEDSIKEAPNHQDYHDKYTTNATKHVAKCFSDCQQALMTHKSYGVPPYMDVKNRKLNLNYQPACFVGSD